LSNSIKQIDAVLFDLDGTLLDTALDFETAINDLLTQEGDAKIEEAEIRQYVTHGSKGIIKAAFKIEEDHPDFTRLQAKLLLGYKNCLTNKTKLFEGLESSLETLHQYNIPWGVVTNKPLEYAQPIMDTLLPESSVLICPDHVKHTKPDPEGLFLACKQLNIKPENSLYIGDHLRDIQAGNAAGMMTVGAAWGYIDPYKDRPNQWGANHVAMHPAALASIIQSYL